MQPVVEDFGLRKKKNDEKYETYVGEITKQNLIKIVTR